MNRTLDEIAEALHTELVTHGGPSWTAANAKNRIWAALSEVREGALRECSSCGHVFIHHGASGCHWRDPAGVTCACTLASRPEPAPCPKCGKRGAACWCPDAAWVNAPEPACPVPNCHAGMLRDHNNRDSVSCPVCDGTLTAEQARDLRAAHSLDAFCARPSPRSETTEDR